MDYRVEEIINLNIDSVCNEILKESELCYRNCAYRGALLFAFSAFLTAIRKKVVDSGKPSAVVQGEWDNLLVNLYDDDKMEKEVLKIINDSTGKYFSISPALKQEVEYWKNKRNVCAHWKQDIIDADIAGGFYSFFLRNVYKFSLKSSIETAIDELRSVYDISKTRPGTSPDNAINRLKYSIKQQEYATFFEQFEQKFNYGLVDKHFIEISDGIMRIGEDSFRESMIDKIRLDCEWAAKLLNAHPRWLHSIFHTEQEFIVCIGRSSNPEDIMDLYAVLKSKNFTTGLSAKKVFDIILDKKKYVDPKNAAIIDDLFWGYFKEKIATRPLIFSEYMWVNERADFIHQILVSKSPDQEIVNALINGYSQQTNSQWLLERFSKKTAENRAFFQAFQSIAATMTIPGNIQTTITEANSP